MARTGILGGTFDPPHIGHLILAEYTAETLGLTTVLFAPVGNHPLKNDVRTPVHHRLNMLKLALDSNDRFAISMVDVERDGPHYSADTVTRIRQQRPDDELYFIMGGDNLRELPLWQRAQDLYKNARLAVMRRSDEDVSPHMHGDALPGLAERVDIVDTPLLSIWLSSTHVVDRLKSGRSVRYLVPQSIIEYIEENQLYKTG